MWVIRISAMLKRTLEKLLTGRGLRHLTARPKLVLCIPIVALSYFMLPATWHGTTRLLIAWNIGTWPYIVLTVRAMARANEASIRRQALMGDQSRFLVLTFCMARYCRRQPRAPAVSGALHSMLLFRGCGDEDLRLFPLYRSTVG